MGIIVKICGLTDEAGIDAAIACGADMAGFVFYEKSPRHISLDRASRLSARVAGRAGKVLLTVDADDALLAAGISAIEPDLLQLHGQENAQRVAAVRARFGLPVMKAIGIAGPAEIAAVPEFDAVADWLLFDAKPAPGWERPGGHGERFDWSVLAAAKPKKPWLLAGGLNPANVARALAVTGACGVDVSSGVETAPGVKDPQRIAAFVREARALRGTAGVLAAAAKGSKAQQSDGTRKQI